MHHKRITIITDSYYPATGGMENAILELAGGLSSQYDVQIISSLKDNSISGLFKRTVLLPIFKEYKDPNNILVKPLVPGFLGRLLMLPIILWHLPLLKKFKAKKLFDFLSIFYSLALSGKLRRLLADSDLILSYSTSFTVMPLIKVCKKLGIPLINAPVIHFGKWGDSPAQIKAYGKSDVLLCPTKYFQSIVKRYYKNRSSVKVAVIPHLISKTQNQFKIPEIDLIPNRFILFIGRREEHKGLKMLVSAYKKSYSTIPLVIIGPGEKIQEGDNIIDLGKVPNSEKEWLLRNCRFLAVPSKDESFGIVYLEAMQHSKPSLALNIPPINELLTNNVNAILSVPGDIATLAENIRKISENDDLLLKLSENCKKEFKERFSYDKILQEYFRIIKQAINGL